jgi:hypothetical protein
VLLVKLSISCSFTPTRVDATLADPEAVISALGYRGSPSSIGLPPNARAAERLPDPKAVLAAAARQVRGKRDLIDIKHISPAIAQRQSLDTLRQAASFESLEEVLIAALVDLGCIV